MFCWERALQLKCVVLPALEEGGNDIPLFVVGIGSVESGRTFTEQLRFPVESLLVDVSETTEVYCAVGTRNSQRDDDTGKQIFEGVGSMWSQATNNGIKERGRDDLNSVTGGLFNPGPYKPLIPTNMEATFVQGGLVCFQWEANNFGAL